ncbi:uncharacterized protein B0I36DRAFT_321388 [Microdochium trichocladiopsis]|uniref:FAD-binding FR-type domain-containing protein n=1 Tax=Microdochium trichocladiopsis TaxID=1682393 RepID=A0A9P8YA60_9PEZI|nr:uncharacterized protein B0I36DRAFT_321388 [Microdochium trichocladiopsis]KAH7033421.1 hypothetical protein B0I36DRAFT_321388 [Microdochium trichocladiopsis]
MATSRHGLCRLCLGLRSSPARSASPFAAALRSTSIHSTASKQTRRIQTSRSIASSARRPASTAKESRPADDSGPRVSGSPPKSRRRGLFAAALVLGAAGWAWLFVESSSSSGEVYPTKFTPFTVTSREQISPTAFILTIRNDQPGAAAINASSVRDAWQHGLWSVEIKQPQLQIARHYTPLPPLVVDSEDPTGRVSGGDEDELRFLVRKMDTGEMSNYLSRRQVGDQIWLRGPHMGFDVSKRLGSAQQVVFLAGGTGIAPALQVAHKLLESKQGPAAETDLPTVSILWANRHGVDALGRQDGPARSSGSPWFSWLWRGSKPATITTNTNTTEESSPRTASPSAGSPSLTRQILDMKEKYGPRFHIEYFVDEENSLITKDDVSSALTRNLGLRNSTSSDPTRCVWHSAGLLERLAGDNDVDRAKDPAHSVCACTSSSNGGQQRQQQAGKNLFFVSGPDGFIRAYAGAKWWHGGMEMQGPVRGLVEGMMRSGTIRKDDWLVLKL